MNFASSSTFTFTLFPIILDGPHHEQKWNFCHFWPSITDYHLPLKLPLRAKFLQHSHTLTTTVIDLLLA